MAAVTIGNFPVIPGVIKARGRNKGILIFRSPIQNSPVAYCVDATADPIVLRSLEWLRHTPPPEWKVEKLSKSMGCSPMTLLRRFRDALGSTPKSVMQRMRLERARQELVDTEDDITEIAYRCGFADAAHFSRCFYKAEKESPSALRKRLNA